MTTIDHPQGTIETELVQGEYRIKINNPSRLNAMSLRMWQELRTAVENVNRESSARVIVLMGAGNKSFVSGADISEFGDRRGSPEQRSMFDDALSAARNAIMSTSLPTIAMIQGICMGGGMALALACDLRYCTNRTRFRMPAARLGLGYDIPGVKRFIDIIGVAATMDLFLTAKTFEGVEAARIGFVTESYDDERFASFVYERITMIKSRAPLTQKAAKLAAAAALDLNNLEAKRIASEAINACFESNDYIEGQQAFLEKREPRFSGK